MRQVLPAIESEAQGRLQRFENSDEHPAPGVRFQAVIEGAAGASVIEATSSCINIPPRSPTPEEDVLVMADQVAEVCRFLGINWAAFWQDTAPVLMGVIVGGAVTLAIQVLVVSRTERSARNDDRAFIRGRADEDRWAGWVDEIGDLVTDELLTAAGAWAGAAGALRDHFDLVQAGRATVEVPLDVVERFRTAFGLMSRVGLRINVLADRLMHRSGRPTEDLDLLADMSIDFEVRLEELLSSVGQTSAGGPTPTMEEPPTREATTHQLALLRDAATGLMEVGQALIRVRWQPTAAELAAQDASAADEDRKESHID